MILNITWKIGTQCVARGAEAKEMTTNESDDRIAWITPFFCETLSCCCACIAWYIDRFYHSPLKWDRDREPLHRENSTMARRRGCVGRCFLFVRESKWADCVVLHGVQSDCTSVGQYSEFDVSLRLIFISRYISFSVTTVCRFFPAA